MREVLCITGAGALSGTVRVSGAKNAALPLIISSLLTTEECVLTNVPDLEDISVLLRLLSRLGAEAEFNSNRVSIRSKEIRGIEAPYHLVKALRASFWILGPLLARLGEARVALPGGDAIGTRPVDLHLAGLSRLGANITMKHGVVIASAPGGLRPAKVNLDYPSVGASHHLLLTAALIPGETLLSGVAREPEVVALGEMLRSMGAQIDGLGSSLIRVRGARELGGASCQVLGDRIEAATYLLGGAVSGGRVTVEGIDPATLCSTTSVLEEAGCTVLRQGNSVSLAANNRLTAVSFETQPYPGVATDVQPLLMAAMTRARGVSVIAETVFENRFGHVAEYRRFGADISIQGRIARVTGVETLSGAPVEASDIRAAAGAVLMAIMAEGNTQIADIYHLDRGYDGLVEKLSSLGVKLTRVPAFEEKEVVLGC